jgi:undecaprenyl-diphosphatase
MAVATLYDLLQSVRHLTQADSAGAVHMDAHGIALLSIGFVTSFFVAWGVVAWFMKWVKSRGFTVFAVYRILLGAGVLIWTIN